MNNLNIYKVSGVAKIGYTDKVEYWLAGTNDLANTRAMNYVLSELNLANTTLSVTDNTAERVELMNQIDLFTIILEGLFAAQQSDVYSVETIGLIISNMVANGAFNSITDELVTRTNNLDALIVEFDNKLKNIPENISTDADFDIWFSENIISEDFNDTPQYVLNNYNGKIGAQSSTLSQKTVDAAPAFLYMFMSENQINACNDLIVKRYNQEIKNWQWETKIVRGAYDEKTILNLYRNGIILHYGMTPEQKIDELFELNEQNGGGKVGWVAIVSAVVAIVGLLISLVYFIVDMYQISYEADDDYKEGVPDQSADGWNLGDALKAKEKGESLTGDKEDKNKDKKTTNAGVSGGNTLLYLGIAAVALLAFLN